VGGGGLCCDVRACGVAVARGACGVLVPVPVLISSLWSSKVATRLAASLAALLAVPGVLFAAPRLASRNPTTTRELPEAGPDSPARQRLAAFFFCNTGGLDDFTTIA